MRYVRFFLLVPIAVVVFLPTIVLAQPVNKIMHRTRSGMQRAPRVIAHEGVVHVVWEDSRNGDWDIYYTISRNRGESFSEEIRVNDDTGSADQKAPAMTVNGVGDVYIVWQDLRGQTDDDPFSGDWDLWLTQKTYNVDEFIQNLPMSRAAGVTRGAQVEPALTFTMMELDGGGSREVPVLVWGDNSRSDPSTGALRWDIKLSWSDDWGASWKTPATVNEESDDFQLWPDIAADSSGRVHVLWTDMGGHNIIRRRAPAPDRDFSSEAIVNEGTAHQQIRGRIEITPGDIVFAVWQDNRNQDQSGDVALVLDELRPWDLYLTRSDDLGAAFESNRPVPDTRAHNQYQPAIAVADEPVFVAWADNRDLRDYDVYVTSLPGPNDPFTTPIQVSDEGEARNADKAPCVAVDEQFVYVVWERQNEGDWDVYFARIPRASFTAGK